MTYLSRNWTFFYENEEEVKIFTWVGHSRSVLQKELWLQNGEQELEGKKKEAELYNNHVKEQDNLNQSNHSECSI